MKTHPDLVELMNGEIDGVNSPEQTESLRRELSARPEAQAEFQALRQVCAAVDAIEEVAPPADLRGSIAEAVRFSQAKPIRAQRAGRARTASWPKSLGFGYLYAAAAGAVLALVLAQLAHIGSGAANPADLVGTLARGSAAAGAGTVALSAPGVQGAAKVQKLDGGYAVEFSFKTSEPVQVVVDFDPSEVGFRGFAQDPEVLQGLELSSRQIRWTQSGDRRTAVLFDPKAVDQRAKVHVSVGRPGQGLAPNEIDLPGQS